MSAFIKGLFVAWLRPFRLLRFLQNSPTPADQLCGPTLFPLILRKVFG